MGVDSKCLLDVSVIVSQTKSNIGCMGGRFGSGSPHGCVLSCGTPRSRVENRGSGRTCDVTRGRSGELVLALVLTQGPSRSIPSAARTCGDGNQKICMA